MANVRQKLNLTANEVALIRALVVRQGYNDQIVLSYFSNPSRTINHRVIGQIRRSRPPYDKITSASDSEVDAFLASYSRLERTAKELGLQLPESYFQLIQKSREAMAAAIAVYNSPLILWKSEIFIVNTVIAWTYALHAYYKYKKIDYRYEKNGVVGLTPDGREKHWDLSKCLDAVECPISSAAKANLLYILHVRHEIEHRITDNVDKYVEAKLQSAALNLENFLTDQFGPANGISEALGSAIQMVALRPEQVEALKKADVPEVITTANAALEEPLSKDDFASPEYAYRVWLLPRIVNHKGQADYVGQYAPDGAVLTIKEVDKKRYSASQVVDILKAEGFKDFSLSKHTKSWNALDGKNPKYKFGKQGVYKNTWEWHDTWLQKLREFLKQ